MILIYMFKTKQFLNVYQIAPKYNQAHNITYLTHLIIL